MAKKSNIIPGGLEITQPERERREELIRYCSSSRASRRQLCEKFQEWYELGQNRGRASIYNKLFSHIDLVSSFLFSPGTVRFGVHLPPDIREAWMDAASVARDDFRQTWDHAGADLMIQLGLDWSLVYGTEALKVQADPLTGIRLSIIQPWDFGVSREDLFELSAQDAMCHWYTLSIPQMRWWLRDHPREKELLALAEAHAKSQQTMPMRQRLVLASITGTFPGGTIAGGFPDEPTVDATDAVNVEEPTVEMVDLWERRLFKRKTASGETEYFEDYLVSSFISGTSELLLERRNPDLPHTAISMRTALPGEHPFELMRPRPRPGMIWGRSELANLTGLQAWLDGYVANIKDIINKQAEPPTFFSGIPDFEEAGEALNSAGGRYGSAEPNAKMDKLIPPLTPETLRVYQMIQSMFDDVSGVPGSISEPGQMPGGVRATGHFAMAAGIGAGRIRRMALTIEDTLSSLATKAFHLLQRTNTSAYKTSNGKPFLLSQIPYMVALSVNGHSAAPIFSEQTQGKAALLQKAGAIGPEDFVELVDPPNREELKEKARLIAENRAKMSQEMMQIQAEKAHKNPPKK